MECAAEGDRFGATRDTDAVAHLIEGIEAAGMGGGLAPRRAAARSPASERCSSEAVLAFGNGEVFVEEYHLRVIIIMIGTLD